MKTNPEVGLEAAIFLRKRNSSLIEFFCFENLQRLKFLSEFIIYQVAERFVCCKRFLVKKIEGIKNEYTGISSHKYCIINQYHRKFKVFNFNI